MTSTAPFDWSDPFRLESQLSDVERMLREVMIARLAPIGQQLALSYIAERELGLPKSY